MRSIDYSNKAIFISLVILLSAGCTKNIQPKLPESELSVTDRLPIRVGLLLDEKTKGYVYKSTGKFLIGKALRAVSLEALKIMFSGVEEVKAVEPFPDNVTGVAQVKLLGFYMAGRGLAHDSYIVLEAVFIDDEGDKIWRELILGEGTSGVFWGDRVESVEASIQDAISELIYEIRRSDEIKEFAVRKFVSDKSS